MRAVQLRYEWNVPKMFFYYGLFSLVMFFLIALNINQVWVSLFDQFLIENIQSWHTSNMTSVMTFISSIGGGIPLVMISCVLFLMVTRFYQQRSVWLFFLWIALGTNQINRLLKAIFERLRPTELQLVEASGYSFPSGHSMGAICLYSLIVLICWNARFNRMGRRVLVIFCGLMIVLMGLSRIYLGVHYPSDVIAGYFAGFAWFGISYFVIAKLRARNVFVKKV
jgi:undecaprenyl-diphosphatase